jgi:hypothetical protein
MNRTFPFGIATAAGLLASGAHAATYPQPVLTGFSPASGPPGTVITVTGTGLTGANTAWVGSAHDGLLTIVSDTAAKLTVPADAPTGEQGLGILNPQHAAFFPTLFNVTSSKRSTTGSVAISVSPSTISLGQSSTLSWTASDAKTCSASGDWSGRESASGSISVTPTAAGTLTYSLACVGGSGRVSGSASLAVAAQARL